MVGRTPNTTQTPTTGGKGSFREQTEEVLTVLAEDKRSHEMATKTNKRGKDVTFARQENGGKTRSDRDRKGATKKKKDTHHHHKCRSRNKQEGGALIRARKELNH